MGVEGLWGHMVKEPFKLNLNRSGQLNNKKIVLDAQSLLCRFAIGSLNAGYHVTDENGNIIVEIYYLLVLAMIFVTRGIVPIFVFDGRSPEIKDDTINKRRLVKEKATELLKPDILGETGDMLIDDHIFDNKESEPLDRETYVKYLKRSFRLNNQNVEKAKLLLRWMGIPVVDSPGEADSQCASLASYYSDDIIGVVTDDSDTLMYGSSVARIKGLASNVVEITTVADVVKNLRDNLMEVINHSSELRKKYEKAQNVITHDTLIDIGCLMGTDYCPGIKIKCENKNRYSTLLELYAKNDMSLEKTLDSMKETLGSAYIERMMLARTMYRTAIVKNPKNINISMTEPDVTMIRKMCKSFISDEEIDRCTLLLLALYCAQNSNSSAKYVCKHFNEKCKIWPDALYRTPILC